MTVTQDKLENEEDFVSLNYLNCQFIASLCFTQRRN